MKKPTHPKTLFSGSSRNASILSKDTHGPGDQSAGQQWCVYTGKFHDSSEMTDDHILSLSMGGLDVFTIRCSKEGNLHVNKTLDEKFARQPFVANLRRALQFKSHRKKQSLVRWDATIADLKASLDMSGDAIQVDSFRSSGPNAINVRQAADGKIFRTEFIFDTDLILRYGCRLALGTGYYLFGDVFREYGYHDELRGLMNSKTAMSDLKFRLANYKPIGFWANSWPHSLGFGKPLYPALCSQQERHLFFTQHGRAETVLGISLFSGLFVWYFNISKDPDKFPIGGDFDLGSATEIAFRPHEFKRWDFRSYLLRFQETRQRS
jgi:hypothetical protein